METVEPVDPVDPVDLVDVPRDIAVGGKRPDFVGGRGALNFLWYFQREQETS
jgi:hypothetical protein